MKALLIMLGIVIGLASAFGILAGTGYGLLSAYPATGIDLTTTQGLIAYIQAASPEIRACIVGVWGLAALIGGWIAAIIARPRPGLAAITIGASLMGVVIAAAGLIPQPEWMPVLAMLLPMPFALLGWRLPPSAAEP